MPQRRKCSLEFKAEVADLTRVPGASIGEIARDLGINPNADPLVP
ncbi:transposase [Salinisphaera sp. PC39]